MLELKSINKRMGTFQIHDLSLCLKQNEYFVLLGPSGSGKTLLIEIIAGLLRADSGEILWQGRDITTVLPEMRNFSIVYQDYALFPHLSVMDNISYGLLCRGMKKKEALLRSEDAAKRLRIEKLLGRAPDSLSGGERQRVALARAIVTSPDLLLLDEPLSALDEENRLRLQEELRQIHGESRTTFFHVTHDACEAAALGDRMGVMTDGHLRLKETPPEARQDNQPEAP
jgi:ABC-type Fe3+/spermidine/putrescine transport system ATPase subunit